MGFLSPSGVWFGGFRLEPDLGKPISHLGIELDTNLKLESGLGAFAPIVFPVLQYRRKSNFFAANLRFGRSHSLCDL